MTNVRETGGFSINGKWATRIAYEADLASGQMTRVDLRFVIGRSLVAQAQLARPEALEILGYKNLAVIEEAATQRKEGTEERIKGELRGRALQYRQATLPGAQPQNQDNSIERENLSARKEQVGALVQSSNAVPGAGERSSSELTGTEATDMPTSPATSLDPRRPPLHFALPEEIVRRFLRVDNQFYFPDRSLAFVDRGTSLKASSENLEVVRTLVAIAQARGWEAIRVNGTENFRSLVWREASRQGIPVRGYTPTDFERAEVEREPVKRDEPRAESTSLNEVRRDSKQHDHEAVKGTRGHQRNREGGAPRPEFVVGKLVDHGGAPYQFDQKRARSYFVTLETPLGMTARWGVDLDRAFAESRTRPRIGDEIGIEFHGARAVTVKADVLDETGRVIGQRQVTKHRNAWVVEKREYIEQRSQRAQALRDERRGKEEIVREYPELVGALATVRLAELFASKNLSTDLDQTRFVNLVRDAMARAIEREAPLPVPKLRETRTRTHGRDAKREKAGIGPDRQSGREPPAMERV